MSSIIEHHVAPVGMAPGNGYSHAVSARGRLVVVAGQVALDANGDLVGRDDPEAQVRQVFENVRRALAAAGASFEDVVKLGTFVTDISILPLVRKIRDGYIDTQRPPASTAVQVVALARPEFLVEVEAYAVVSDEAG